MLRLVSSSPVMALFIFPIITCGLPPFGFQDLVKNKNNNNKKKDFRTEVQPKDVSPAKISPKREKCKSEFF